MGCIRHALSKKERKSLIKEINEKYPFLNLSLKKTLEIGICNGYTVYFYDGKPFIVKVDDKLIPLLKYLLKMKIEDIKIPKVVVDMGAVKHILNGADVMAPGIVSIEGSFMKGDVVLVIDEKYRKPLAIGLALYDSTEISSMRRGKVVLNIHFAGDRIWKLSYS